MGGKERTRERRKETRTEKEERRGQEKEDVRGAREGDKKQDIGQFRLETAGVKDLKE